MDIGGGVDGVVEIVDEDAADLVVTNVTSSTDQSRGCSRPLEDMHVEEDGVLMFAGLRHP